MQELGFRKRTLGGHEIPHAPRRWNRLKSFRRLVVVMLAAATSLAMLPPVPAVVCSDFSQTFNGTASGGPEEVVTLNSLDVLIHSAEIGSESCRVASITAALTSATAPDLDLYVNWEGFEVGSQADEDANETVTKTDMYGGTWDFRVVPFIAENDAYSLSVTADVEPITAVSGTNATKPFVVVAVVDTGINPYHDEFSSGTYSDGSASFAVHPSTYVEEYPASASALNLSLNTATYAAAVASDASAWSSTAENTLYWIPGTKIIGAYDGGGGIQSGQNILDNNGHGTASAGVAAGNTKGSCTRCLIVAVEGTGGLDWALSQPWIDIVSNSWGNQGNVGIPEGGQTTGDLTLGNPRETRAAVARGQTVLFAAGNGYENGFVTPEATHTSPFTGPEWVMTVGAVKRTENTENPYCNCPDDDSIVFGSGKPVDVSSFGAGTIPSAAFNSISALGNHSGTSAATPLVAGVMGDVLRHARVQVGDAVGGSRDGIVATGTSSGTGFIANGVLTRAELETAIKYTAEHTRTQWIGGFPPSLPTGVIPAELTWAQWEAEGWGVVLPRTGVSSKAVVDGTQALPSRPMDEDFAARDKALRDALWGPAS